MHEWIIEQEDGEQVIGTTEYFPKGYDKGTIIGKTLEILPVCTTEYVPIGWVPYRRLGKVIEYLGTVGEKKEGEQW